MKMYWCRKAIGNDETYFTIYGPVYGDCRPFFDRCQYYITYKYTKKEAYLHTACTGSDSRNGKIGQYFHRGNPDCILVPGIRIPSE